MLYLLKYFLTALAHKPPLLVDVREQNDSEPAPQTNVSSTEETPASRKSAREREKTPPPRKKPMGPASKRMKVDTESPPPLSILPHQPQTTQAAPQPATEINIKQNPVEQQFMHFKLEPEETAVSLANEEDVSYDDSAMDDMGIDNSSDYLMESTTEIDAKAGTSTAMDNVDATGDNQDKLNSCLTLLGTLVVEINDLKQRFMVINGGNSCDVTDDIAIKVKNDLPLKSREEVSAFEVQLSTSEDYRREFVKIVSQVGGATGKDYTTRVLDTIFSRKFATENTWEGKRTKYKINTLKLIELCEVVILNKFPMWDKAEFAKAGINWFRLGNQRAREQPAQVKQKTNPAIVE